MMNKVNKELKEFHEICSKYLVRDGLTNCYKTSAYDNCLGNKRVVMWTKLNGIRIGEFLKCAGYNGSRVIYDFVWYTYYDIEQVELETKLKKLVNFVKNETVKIKKRNLEKDFEND